MKILLFQLLFIVSSHNMLCAQLHQSKAPAITPVLNDVFKFTTKRGITGTCFKAQYKEKVYMISAKHLFPEYHKEDTVSIYFNRNENLMFAEGLFIMKYGGQAGIDLVVMEFIKGDLPPSDILLPDEPQTVNFRGEYFLLGFPGILPAGLYGRKTEYDTPEPLVKRLEYSGRIKDSHGAEGLVFNGTLVGGFSGGPVIHYDNELKSWILSGVASGFISDYGSTHDLEPRIGSAKDDTITIAFNAGMGLYTPGTYVGSVAKGLYNEH